VQKLLDEDPNLDEDQADMLKAAACLLAVAAVKKAKAKARERRVRRERKRKSVWVREWLLKRHKYGKYNKLMQYLTERDVKSFRNFARMDPDKFNQMVKDLPLGFRRKQTTAESLCPLDSSWPSL